MGLFDQWNQNKFSIYKSDEKTVLKLLESFFSLWFGPTLSKIDETDQLANDNKNNKVSYNDIHNKYKLSDTGDFTGSWWGIEKPVHVEGGIDAVVEKNSDDIVAINLQLLGIVYNAKLFGIVGDGTDETIKIQSFLDSVPDGSTIKFNKTNAFYGITKGLNFTNRKNLSFVSDGAEIKYLDGTTDVLYNAFPDYCKDSNFRFINADKIDFVGFIINGNISHRTAYVASESFNSCVALLGCTNVSFKQCTFKEGMTDGVTIVKDASNVLCDTVTFDECIFINNRRNNISCVSQRNVTIKNSDISYAGAIQGIAPQCNIDIEPDFDQSSSYNITIENCNIHHAIKSGISVGGKGTDGLKVIRCDVHHNGEFGMNFADYGQPGDNSENVKVTLNTVHDNANMGVRMVGKNVELFQQNRVYNNLYGVVGFNSENLDINNNDIFYNLYNGMQFNTFVRVNAKSNTLHDNTSVQGDIDGAGYAMYASPLDINSVLNYDNNFMYSTTGSTTLQNGAKLTANCNCQANNNTGKNLKNNNAMLTTNMKGVGNVSIDGSERYKGTSITTNFDDVSANGGRLLIGSKYHYHGTSAPTTGTWEVGDRVWNTAYSQVKNIEFWKCISISPLTWRAFGIGDGATVDMPSDLTVNDRGYQYHDNTTNTFKYWNGSIWV